MVGISLVARAHATSSRVAPVFRIRLPIHAPIFVKIICDIICLVRHGQPQALEDLREVVLTLCSGLFFCAIRRHPSVPMFDNLNQGKYNQTILKAQIGVTHLGQICLSTGLHGGLPCDTEVWRSTADRHPLLTGEWWFGDGIYIAEHGILAKKKKPSNRNLSCFTMRALTITGHAQSISLPMSRRTASSRQLAGWSARRWRAYGSCSCMQLRCESGKLGRCTRAMGQHTILKQGRQVERTRNM